MNSVSVGLMIMLCVNLISCGGGSGGSSTAPSGGQVPGAQQPVDGPEVVVANSRGLAGITAFNNTVHLIYEENSVIYYRRSTDEGATWSPQTSEQGRELASSGTPYLIDPLINDGVNLYLFYVRINEYISDFFTQASGQVRPVGDLYVVVSRDGGITWDSEQALTTSGRAFRLSATAPSTGVVHLTWMDFEPGNFAPLGDYGTWNIEYIKTQDSFQSFARSTLLEGTGNFGVERPSIKAIGDNVYLTWMQERLSFSNCSIAAIGPEIPSCPGTSFMRSIDGGENWSSPVDLSPAADFYASRGTIAASKSPANNEDVLIIAYDEFVDTAVNYGLDIRTVVSTDSGLNWSTASPNRLTESTGDSTHAHVNGSDGEFYISWHDVREAGGTQILWSHLSEPYQNWNSPMVLSTDTGDTPLVASSENYSHVIWLGANTTSYKRISKN